MTICRRCKGTGKEFGPEEAAHLAEHRRSLNITLRVMAERIGCSIPYLSDIEHGNRRMTTRMLDLYAKALAGGLRK